MGLTLSSRSLAHQELSFRKSVQTQQTAFQRAALAVLTSNQLPPERESERRSPQAEAPVLQVQPPVLARGRLRSDDCCCCLLLLQCIGDTASHSHSLVRLLSLAASAHEYERSSNQVERRPDAALDSVLARIDCAQQQLRIEKLQAQLTQATEARRVASAIDIEAVGRERRARDSDRYDDEPRVSITKRSAASPRLSSGAITGFWH